jgi:hypothetical protein
VHCARGAVRDGAALFATDISGQLSLRALSDADKVGCLDAASLAREPVDMSGTFSSLVRLHCALHRDLSLRGVGASDVDAD